jgi:hypothetical protein
MTLDTSLAGVGPQRCPLPSTTRTELAPVALMLANELVCCWYQTCAWLTPRSTSSVPLASTRRPLLIRIPVAA